MLAQEVAVAVELYCNQIASMASGPPRLVGLHSEWALVVSKPMH